MKGEEEEEKKNTERKRERQDVEKTDRAKEDIERTVLLIYRCVYTIYV